MIARLYKASPLYPKYLKETQYQGEPGKLMQEIFVLSTIVRIERKGIWYKIHLVEQYLVNQSKRETDIELLLQRFIQQAYFIILYAVPSEMVVADKDQTSEILRVKAEYFPYLPDPEPEEDGR